MNNVALLIVDVQNLLVNDNPFNKDKVIKNIKKLLEAARKNNKKVIFVRHDDGKGSGLERGTEGWQIYNEVEPIKGEVIVEKRFNSAFHKTNLKEHLNNIDTLVLVGLQTEYCIDATLKSAFDNDYKVIIPRWTNTTFDNEYLSGEKLYEFYNYNIWDGRFAELVSVDEMIEEFRK